MWKDYSISYIKKNKATSISIMVAAFIAAMFISMVCGLFYNIWVDDISRLVDKEGGWQARFVTEMSEADIQLIQNYSNVKEVIISGNGTEVYFEELSTIYSDMTQIANMLNIQDEEIEYHNSLLMKQFIFSAEEKEQPPLILVFYVCILLLVCISLILIIKSAFQFSMNSRVHQLGILQSIGATPKQLRAVLIQEALVLSVIPILLGTILGTGLCFLFLRYANTITRQLEITEAVFVYHYLLFMIPVVCSFITLFLSAWFPARKLSKISPLQAIKGEYEVPFKRMRKFRLTSALFGVEGELARKSLYIRRKAFRTYTICITISFLVFTMFLDFITISKISTGHTYFEKYKNTWDIMIEIYNPDTTDTGLLNNLKMIDGVDTMTAYQKNRWYTAVTEDGLSDEMKAIGGYGAPNSSSVFLQEGSCLVETDIVALDNESYMKYSMDVGAKREDIDADTSSVIVINRIWDSKHSDFKNKEYIPILQPIPEQKLEVYANTEAVNEGEKVTVSAYTEITPDLREEYDKNSLIQIMSQDTYEKLKQKLPATDETMYINICAISDDFIENIEDQCKGIIGSEYQYTMENRPERQKASAEMYDGYKRFMGAICGLLACIGIANVFANTLGYIYQRKREFARYQSIGLTPEGISKMLWVEAFIIAVKPILISIPFNILFIIFGVNQSVVEMSEFVAEMPIVPMFVFAFIIFAAVGLSYFIGSKQMKNDSIVEALKNDMLF